MGREFFNDKRILFLGTLTGGLVILNILLLIIRVDLDAARAVFRHWLVGETSQLTVTDPIYLYSFIVLTFVVLFSSWIVSYRVYEAFKPAAYFTFVLAQITLVANLLVSEALLRL